MAKLTRLTPMLDTLDLRHTVDWYVNVLGCKLDVLWPADEPVFCMLEMDEVSFSFTINTHEPGTQPKLTGQLYIETTDVLQMYERIKGKAEVRWGPEVYHYQRREFAIYDCNGYTLTFSEPTDDPPTCAEA